MKEDYRVFDYKKSGGFYIGKVYYDDEGEPKDWTKEDVAQFGVWQSVVDINKDLKLMIEALAKPVLQESGGKLREAKSNNPTEEEIARWEEESPSRYTQPEEHWANP